MPIYHIARNTGEKNSFNVVYEDVRTRTSKGYPLTYEVKSLPGEFQSWEDAHLVVNQLNAEGYSPIRHLRCQVCRLR